MSKLKTYVLYQPETDLVYALKIEDGCCSLVYLSPTDGILRTPVKFIGFRTCEVLKKVTKYTTIIGRFYE
jgi:hypothetical protein